MFYNDVYLRKGGKFYLVWLADFYPRRFSTLKLKKQIWNLNICTSCDELREVIMSESGTASKKFSLRLSSHLIRGLVILYAKKVNLFSDYLFNLSAKIYHQSNATNEEAHLVTPRRRKRRVTAAAPPIINENRVIERLQEAENIVQRQEDITIREDILPPTVLPNDGFGEDLVPPEVMRAPEVSIQGHSRMDLELTDGTKEGTSLMHHTGRMELLQEIDVFDPRKSIGADVTTVFDLEKDVPQIPDILPEIPKEPTVLEKTREEVIPAEKQLERTTDFDLEELVALPTVPKNRRRKNRRLIVDKYTMLSGKYMRKRLENVHLELRHTSLKEDIVDVCKVSSYLLFRVPAVGRPCRIGSGHHTASTVDTLFVRNLIAPIDIQGPKGELEKMLSRKPLEPIMENEVLRIPSIIEQTRGPELNHEPSRLEEQNFDQENVRPRNSDIESHRISVTVDVHKPMYEEEELTPPTKKRKLDSGREVSTRNPQQVPLPELPPPVYVCEDQQVDPDSGRRDRTVSSVGDEPQLGSLDRTNVSVDSHKGDSDIKKYLDEHWGSRPTYEKVRQHRARHPNGPLPPRTLLAPTASRLAAAKCFCSLLKLCQHNYIKLVKHSETYEIIDILLVNREM